jgi:hypothetical protein
VETGKTLRFLGICDILTVLGLSLVDSPFPFHFSVFGNLPKGNTDFQLCGLTATSGSSPVSAGIE